MSHVTIERRDLIKKNYKRTVGNTIDNENKEQQDSNNPMINIKDGNDKIYQIDSVCYNDKWFIVAPESDQKRLTREWDERKI